METALKSTDTEIVSATQTCTEVYDTEQSRQDGGKRFSLKGKNKGFGDKET